MLFIPAKSAIAQSNTLTLSLIKLYGYNGFGGDIQGSFRLVASGPTNLVSVNFFLDDVLIGSTDQDPFQIQFNTNNYSVGSHTFFAVAYDTRGEELCSNEIHAIFLSEEQSRSSVLKIILPILGLTFIVIMISGFVPLFLKQRSGTIILGQYGSAGGAVCQRCGLPFSRSYFGLNLVIGKLERCPHCGKWGVLRRALPEELKQAEARLQADYAAGAHSVKIDDKLHLQQSLEESRYED